MDDRGHNRHEPKRGGGAPVPLSRELGPWLAGTPSNSMWPGPRLYFRTKWRLHPSSRLATIDVNRKLGDVPFLGGTVTPSNTTSPGPRFAFVQSGISIHPADWPR